MGALLRAARITAVSPELSSLEVVADAGYSALAEDSG
jgi:hypothetical protein